MAKVGKMPAPVSPDVSINDQIIAVLHQEQVCKTLIADRNQRVALINAKDCTVEEAAKLPDYSMCLVVENVRLLGFEKQLTMLRQEQVRLETEYSLAVLEYIITEHEKLYLMLPEAMKPLLDMFMEIQRLAMARSKVQQDIREASDAVQYQHRYGATFMGTVGASIKAVLDLLVSYMTELYGSARAREILEPVLVPYVVERIDDIEHTWMNQMHEAVIAEAERVRVRGVRDADKEASEVKNAQYKERAQVHPDEAVPTGETPLEPMPVEADAKGYRGAVGRGRKKHTQEPFSPIDPGNIGTKRPIRDTRDL